MSEVWNPIGVFSHLEWRQSSAPNAVYARIVGDSASEVILEGRDEFAQWVADHSARPTHVPLGDWVHNVADALGFKRCLPCAERQIRWNNWLKR